MGIFDGINDWLKELLIEGIIGNFNSLFDEVNTKVGDIANQVGATPQGWNAGIFNMIKNLSDTVIVPIAGLILTFVLTYELISMFIEKNNLHDLDTWVFFKWTFKTFVAVYLVTNAFNIVMAVFDVGRHVVEKSASLVTGSLDVKLAISDLEGKLGEMGTGELIGLFMESSMLGLAMKAISVCIFLIIYGRMLEIYLTISIAPIPLSTMANREWGGIGQSYIKALFALAFQGFLIMVCVAIYAVLLQTIPQSDNIHAAIWGCAGYTVLLCFTLFKTGTLSKGLFSAH